MKLQQAALQGLPAPSFRTVGFQQLGRRTEAVERDVLEEELAPAVCAEVWEAGLACPSFLDCKVLCL